MIGAIHRPQRSTRMALSTSWRTPSSLNSLRSGLRSRFTSAVRKKRLMENSGAAKIHWITPDSDSR